MKRLFSSVQFELFIELQLGGLLRQQRAFHVLAGVRS
jgi:hypothetical protein